MRFLSLLDIFFLNRLLRRSHPLLKAGLLSDSGTSVGLPSGFTISAFTLSQSFPSMATALLGEMGFRLITGSLVRSVMALMASSSSDHRLFVRLLTNL